MRNGGGTSMAGATCTSPGWALARRPGHRPHEWSLHKEPSHLEKCCHHAIPKALFGLPRKAPVVHVMIVWRLADAREHGKRAGRKGCVQPRIHNK